MTAATYLGKITVAPDGTLGAERHKVNVGTTYYTGGGGNEDRYVLVGYSGGWALWDVVNGSLSGAASIPSLAGETGKNLVPFSAGSTFLVLHSTSGGHHKLQRYTMDVSVYPRQAVELGPLMNVPDSLDVYDGRMVYDEGIYTAVFGRTTHSAPDGVGVAVAIFDNANEDPVAVIDLSDGANNTVWDGGNDFVAGFARVDGTWQLLYPRAALHQVDLISKGWSSYVRAELDMATYTVSAPVLITDFYTPQKNPLLRSDSGVSLLGVKIHRDYVASDIDTPGKLVLGVMSPTDASAGDALLEDWRGDAGSPDGTYTPLMLVGTGVTDTSSTPGGSGDTGLPSNTAAMARFGDLSFELVASLKLTYRDSAPAIPTEQALSGRSTVTPYYVVRGQALAHAFGGIDATADAGMGTMTTGDSWPDPSTVTVGSDLRWLPDRAHVSFWADPQINSWYDTTTSATFYLDAAPGPEIDEAGFYMRGEEMVTGPMISYSSFNEGGGGSTDPFDFPGLTMFLVATLRPPEFEYSVLLGTGDVDFVPKPDTPFVEVRYYPDGRLVTYARSQLGSFQTATGVVRAGQPIIVGMSLDTVTGIVTTVACDRNAAFAQMRLPGDHPTPIVAYLADTPDTWITPVGAAPIVANMDVLEVDIWQRALNTDELAAAVHVLDGIYGVTRS